MLNCRDEPRIKIREGIEYFFKLSTGNYKTKFQNIKRYNLKKKSSFFKELTNSLVVVVMLILTVNYN